MEPMVTDLRRVSAKKNMAKILYLLIFKRHSLDGISIACL